MIKTCSIYNFRNETNYDVAYAIVRSMSKPIIGAQQLKCLSPDYNLFKTYLNLRDKGLWNKESFEKLYKPYFIQQIENDKLAQRVLEELAEQSKTKNILLLCYCKDKDLCHRSLIGNMLREKYDANVIIR